MKFKYLLIIFLSIFTFRYSYSQEYLPQMESRYFTSDSISVLKPKPFWAAGEVIGTNLAVWAFDRYVVKESWARINWNTIKSNFKRGPVWDSDKFTTNLFAHPYHGGLYFNAARSNGLNFWQSIPYSAGGSLMWEFFMETEAPSINDMMATTFGGVALGEITYRLSDLFIDNQATGWERVGRELLTGIISPMRGINRLITGESWKRRSYKGRSYSNVPVNLILSMGPRFLADEEKSRKGSSSLHFDLALNYGNPFNDENYTPYEWFRFKLGMDVINQPLINQVNAIGALWGKNIWQKDNRSLMFGIFQHFDYYDSDINSKNNQLIAPYRISEAAAAGLGAIYYKNPDPGNKTLIYGELYTNGVALGASLSDYMKLGERDYNLGSGYSIKGGAGLIYNKQLALLLNLENYHIFTWKGYDPDLDWSTVDPNELSVQGDKSNARLTVFSILLAYQFKKQWSIALSNRFFNRKTDYKYHDTVDYATYDLMLKVGYRL